MYGKFSPARIPGQALLRLSKCYQRHDESIANYVIRLKSLGNEILAEDLQNAVQENIPGLKQKCEELVLNQFRIGIKKELMKQLTPLLMRTENLNLETAEKFAKQFELSELMINSRNQSSVVMTVQERKCFYCGKNNHFSQNCRFRIDERNKRNYSNQHHNFQNVRQETPKQQHYRYENYKTNYNHHQQHPSRFHVNNFQKHNFRYNNKSFHNDNVPRDYSFLRRNNTYKEELDVNTVKSEEHPIATPLWDRDTIKEQQQIDNFCKTILNQLQDQNEDNFGFYQDCEGLLYKSEDKKDMFYFVLLFVSATIVKCENQIFESGSANTDCACEIEKDYMEVECRCVGPEFLNIPRDLPTALISLIIEDAGIEVLKQDSLLPYASTLRDLTLINLEHFYYFETDVFLQVKQLQSIYIHRAPKLIKIQPEVFSVNLPQLKILRIVNTGLEEIPNLNNLNTDSVLHMM
ncbi:hypothetical protein RN001_001436 [Aquatica leii]|uniref:CCHC-type domain-containing protein n=1 Tax=Aquatica leii TaxID=1421715 RepID=A0AAN7SSM7_9COLE|nr:hypothetical protein RN001_001436 [Aquatica leii]